MADSFRLIISGDRSLTVEFGNEISEEINGLVQALALYLRVDPIDGVTELVPTYRSLTIHYLPEIIDYHTICHKVKAAVAQCGGQALPEGELVEIPVLYGGEMGPDMDAVCTHCALAQEEVIQIHSAPLYLIHMLGFTPGFPYLGGMDSRIATPRLQIPRVKIPAGSVGIAGGQTGVYPIASPGGWQLIGRTPLVLFDPYRNDPILLKAGQRIRFVPIDRAEYVRLEGRGND